MNFEAGTFDVHTQRLREDLRVLGPHAVHRHFMVLGGTASAFEVDAFAYGLSGLEPADIAVLDQAVWEAREFGER